MSAEPLAPTPPPLRQDRSFPVVMVTFTPPLTRDAFAPFVSRIMNEKDCLVWVSPVWLGPTKVHVYGALRGAFWTPANWEINESGFVCMIAGSAKMVVTTVKDGKTITDDYRIAAAIRIVGLVRRMLGYDAPATVGAERFETWVEKR